MGGGTLGAGEARGDGTVGAGTETVSGGRVERGGGGGGGSRRTGATARGAVAGAWDRGDGGTGETGTSSTAMVGAGSGMESEGGGSGSSPTAYLPPAGRRELWLMKMHERRNSCSAGVFEGSPPSQR